MPNIFFYIFGFSAHFCMKLLLISNLWKLSNRVVRLEYLIYFLYFIHNNMNYIHLIFNIKASSLSLKEILVKYNVNNIYESYVTFSKFP